MIPSSAAFLLTKLSGLAMLSGPVALVTVRVYVLVVVPFWAVTTVVMVFDPTDNGRLWDAVPEVTAVPFTFTVALASAVVGVIVIAVTLLATLQV